MTLSPSTSTADTLLHGSTCGLEYCHGHPTSACPLHTTIMPFQHVYNSAARIILLKLISVMAFSCLEPSNGPQLIQSKARSLQWPLKLYVISPHLTPGSHFLLTTLLFASFLLPHSPPCFLTTLLLALFPCIKYRPTCLEHPSHRYSQDLLPYLH